MARVALPPGLYYISVLNRAGLWLTAKNLNQPLQLDGLAKKNVWKVTGSGQLLYPSTKYYASSKKPADDVDVIGTPAPVKPDGSWSNWSINVVDNKNGSFEGYIMSNNDEVVYWSIAGDDKSVNMKGDRIEWVFTPKV